MPSLLGTGASGAVHIPAGIGHPEQPLEHPGVEPPIPKCYRFGMTKQIAVRLPEELVDFVDGVVADGGAKSRAAVVARALTREQRRLAAERDVEILIREGEDEDMAALAKHLAHRPLGLD